MTKTERDLTDGRRWHDAGEFVKAEAIYNRVLKREPTNIHARFFLGALKAQTGRNDEAVTLLEHVIAERPNWEEAHNNLAVTLQSLGRYAEALMHYKKAAEINPDFTEAHSNATYILHLLKRNEAALTAVDRALELQPDQFDALFNRFSILKALGRTNEARESLVKASEHAPRDCNILMTMGVELSNAGEHSRSVTIFELTLEAFPEYPQAYNCLAAALDRTWTPFNRHETRLRMLDLLDKCVELAPEYIDGQINRATLLQKLRRNEEAREIFNSVVEQGKERYDLLNNYAASLMESGLYDESIEYCKRSIAITDSHAEPFYNWGACLHLKGELDAAREKYEYVLTLNPRHIDAHSALSLMYLTLGDFERGWAEYEWRKKTDQYSGRLLETHFLDPSTVSGKRILLHAEQGQGDTFQFVRYADAIQKLGGRAFVECHDGLAEVIKTCPWVDEVRERKTQQDIVFEQQSSLLSLPFIFKTNLESVPSQVPYLSAPAAYRPKWASRIAELTPAGTRLKVGIAWAGNPGHYNDQQRSTTLAKFEALSRVSGVTFFSVQKGAKPEEQLANPPAGMQVIALGPEIQNFSDTAAILENLDLLIAVDTGVVHLAGAMGIPVWTLLPLCNDFRWLMGRDDSPWYPTMRLFRQRDLWDYDYVFEQVAKELEAYAADPVRWNIDDATKKFDSGHRAQAKVQLLALTQRFVGNVRMINAIGEFLWADGDTKEALQMFLGALQIDPSDRRTIANCARVLDAFGQRADARAIYRNYMNAHPEDSDFAEALPEFGEERLLAAA